MSNSIYRLAVTQEWWTTNIVSQYKELGYFLSEEVLIRNIINKILLKRAIFVSEIVITRSENLIQIKFLFFGNQNIIPIIYFLQFLLQRIFLLQFCFKIVRVPTVTSNAYILAQFIRDSLGTAPNKRRYRSIIKRVISQSTRWSNYKQK